MKRQRVRRLRSKILSTQVNLRNIIKNTELSLKQTVPVSDFKQVTESFLSLAECYESLLEFYEMDANQLSVRELKLLEDTLAHDLIGMKDVLRDSGYSPKEQKVHREYVADLKAICKKLKRMETA